MKGQKQLAPSEQKQRFDQMINNCNENKYCADCHAKSPSWGSLGFGVLICLNCAGAHRSLGYHITRVRSVKLDGWDLNQIEILENTGNKISNDYWEYKLSSYKRPVANTSQSELQRFVEEKYIKKMFAPGKEYLDPVNEYQQNKLKPSQQQKESTVNYKEFYIKQDNPVQNSSSASPPTKSFENPVKIIEQQRNIPNVDLLDFQIKEEQPKNNKSGDLLDMTAKEPLKAQVQEVKQIFQQQQLIIPQFYNQQQQNQFFTMNSQQQALINQQYNSQQNNYIGFNQRNYNYCQINECLPQSINQMHQQKKMQPVDIFGMYE